MSELVVRPPIWRHLPGLFPLGATREPLGSVSTGALSSRILIPVLYTAARTEIKERALCILAPWGLIGFKAAYTTVQVSFTVHESSPDSFCSHAELDQA